MGAAGHGTLRGLVWINPSNDTLDLRVPAITGKLEHFIAKSMLKLEREASRTELVPGQTNGVSRFQLKPTH
jgi:hypothetical protein